MPKGSNILFLVFLALCPGFGFSQSDASLAFVKNLGQFEPEVLFRVQLHHGYIYLEKNGITFKLFEEQDYNEHHRHLSHDIEKEETAMRGHSFQYRFLNSMPLAIEGLEPFQEKHNYFLGNDKKKWASHVPLFSEVVYKNIYPSIDLKIFSQFGRLKYEWEVNPGAQIKDISIEIIGLDSLSVKENNLLLYTSIGCFPDKNLWVWQKPNKELNARQLVASQYRITHNVVSYFLPEGYDQTLPLIIDPVLVFSTYSGSKGDNFGFTATYDARGNLYAGGITDNTHGEYPVTKGAFQDSCHKGYGGTGGRGRPPVNLPCDITISKYDSSGKNLLYATYVGGSDDEYPHSMVVNSKNELMVFGTSYSFNFPMLASGYDTSHHRDTGSIIDTDIVVFILSEKGDSLKGSTFFGGSKNDGLTNSALRYNYADDFRGEVLTDKSDNIFVVSNTNSPKLPMIKSIKDTLEGVSDGICLKFSKGLDQLLWSTYYGGNNADAIYSLEFDQDENIYIGGGTSSTNLPKSTGSFGSSNHGGIDGFVASFKKDSFSLKQSTYFGTAAYDQLYFLEIDKLGKIYATGQTEGNITASYGTYNNRQNAGQFIFICDDSLKRIHKQTVFGSMTNKPNFSPSAFLVDSCGSIYISGWGLTSGLPITSNALQSSTDGQDFYLAVFAKNISSLLFGTFFGGNKSQDHVDGGTSRFDKKGIIYQSVCSSCPGTPGSTLNDFPTTSSAAFPKNVSWRCSNAAFKIDFQINNVVKAKFKPDSILCGPADIQFSNQSIGNGRYFWSFGDGQTSTALVPKHSYADTGKYTIQLIAIDSNACNFSDTAIRKIQVLQKPTALFTAVVSKCFNQVEITHKSKDFTTLHWNYGDGNQDQVQSPNPRVYKYDTGSYRLSLITDANKFCKDSMSLNLKINEIKYVKALFKPDTTLCGPARVQFKNYSDSSATYFWDFGDDSTSSAKNPLHSFPSTGQYHIKLIVTDSNSCNGSDSVLKVVNILKKPDAIFNLKQYKCNWEIDLKNSSKSYRSVKWSFGDGNSSTDSNLTSYTYNSPGKYKLTLYADNNYCSDSMTKELEIKIKTYVKAGFEPDTLFCGPGTVKFRNVGTGAYLWDFGDSKTSTDTNPSNFYAKEGVFRVKLAVKDSSTCNEQDSAFRTVEVIPIPKADFNLIVQRCRSEVEVENNSVNHLYSNWQFGDGALSTLENPISHVYSNTGTYTITLKIAHKICKDSISKTFELKPKTFVIAGFKPDTALCDPGDVQFRNLSSGSGLYRWDFGEGSTSALFEPMHRFNRIGRFITKLLVEDTSTCNLKDSAFRTIDINPQSHAAFHLNVSECLSHVEIINNSETFQTVDWDFGDGGTSQKEHPGIYTYKDSGKYRIRLITDAGNVCPDTAYFLAHVTGTPADIFLPINVFTPDGDGLNDCFHFGGRLNHCSEIKIYIYDRWGLKMFETDDFNSCWNGRIFNSGRECPEATYFYLCHYKGESTSIQSRFSGTVTLIRGK